MNQIIANIIITLSWVSLVALGFSLIYHVAGFFHIAHGVIMYMGACIAILTCNHLKISIPLGIIIGCLFAASLGACAELFIYRPIRRRNPHRLILLLSSIGLMLFLQSIAGVLWGVDPLIFRGFNKVAVLSIMGARVTIVQLYIVFSAILLTMLTYTLIYISGWGRSLRAVASNRWLARTAGIRTDKIVLFTFVVASALAGLAGSMIALDVAATPDMAMNALLLGVVAAIIAGANPLKIVFGALIVSTLRHLSMWLGSTLWSDAVMFTILLGVLLIRGDEMIGDSSQ
jgi:branched-chain amino acid transport system permease protein